MLKKGLVSRMTASNTPKAVKKAVNKLNKINGSGLLSAATKAFWMIHGHPVVIYDSNARRGLSLAGSVDYATYFTEWFTFYKKNLVDVKDAQNWVSGIVCRQEFAGEWDVSCRRLRAFIQSRHFANRVVDVYLFHKGRDARDEQDRQDGRSARKTVTAFLR